MADDTRLSKRQLKKLVKEQGAVVKQDPNNLVARLKLAGALKDLGNGKEAVGHYQTVAQAYVETGKLVQAISVYKGILELTPGDVTMEAALTELSARRAKEVKSKSLPRLQQVDGRWVIPTESSASEEEGTDPGREVERTPSSTASVLRLPAHLPGSDLPPARRSRRSRPRLPDVHSASPAPLPPEVEDVDGVQEAAGGGGVGPKDAVRPLPPLAPLPEPMSFDSGLPAASMTPQPSLPGLFQSDQRGDAVMEPAAQSPSAADPEPEPEPEALEEETSPGPGSYSETIRRSAVHLDVAAIATPPRPPSTPQPRRTIVGVPLPDHPDLANPARVAARSARTRPTDLAAGGSVSADPTDLPGNRPDVDGPMPKGQEPPHRSEDAHETRALRSVGEPAQVTSAPSLQPHMVPFKDVPEAILGSVFDEDEEALWAELSSEGDAQTADESTVPVSPTQEPDRSTRPLKSAAQAPQAATGDRLVRATLPLPALEPQQAGPLPSRPSTDRPPGTLAGKDPAPSSVSQEPMPQPVSLESIALFRDLSETSRALLTSRVVTRREKTGAEVVREGDPGNALFVVSAGRVRVTKTGREGQSVYLASLGPGAFFGEFALLSDRKRHATVTVEEDSVLFEISRKVIADLTRGEPAFGNTLRAFYRRRLLATLLGSAPFFESLTHEERESLMGRLRFRRVAEGTKIITEGEPGGGFYLILIGQVQVTKTEPGGSQRVLARLGDGAYFGEMSLLKGGNAVASVTTLAPTEIVQLAAAEFYRILSKYPKIWEEVNQEAKRRALANLQILSGRSPSALRDEDGVVM